MDQLHHHKTKLGFDLPITVFDHDEIVHQWQTRASKMLHAQERIAQGMAAAMRAQIRYGQEFLVSHLNMMQWELADAAHLSEQARKDIENFAALVKEVSGEIRNGFAEAEEMLKEKAAAPATAAALEPVAMKAAPAQVRHPTRVKK